MSLQKNNLTKLKNLQDSVKALFSRVAYPRLGSCVSLQVEVGSLSKLLMDIEIFGGSLDKNKLNDACADVFFSILDICNAYDIDFSEISGRKITTLSHKIDRWEKEHGTVLRIKRESYDKS